MSGWILYVVGALCTFALIRDELLIAYGMDFPKCVKILGLFICLLLWPAVLRLLFFKVKP